MKKVLQILCVFFVVIFYGQQISDYQNILIPEKFNNAGANNYQLDAFLKAKLKEKKFTVFNETETESKNPCDYLKAEIADVGNMFMNKVRIEFNDCHDKNIATFEGKSGIKEFKEGMREALQKAMMTFPTANPLAKTEELKKAENIPTTQKNENPVVTKVITSTNKVEMPMAVKTENNSSQKAEIYTNGTLTLNKVLLSNGEFILVNPNNSVPYGIFKPSTKKDTFRVQMSDGTSTLGYLEDGKIVVEKSNADGSLKTEVFEKK